MKHPTPAQQHIAIWLFTCAFFIFSMVAIGGLTRLTHSGLSITEWKPISGVFPPLSESAWQDEFAGYKQSPEYLKKNLGMSLEEFKGIFWLEFIHRLVGRLTGFVFLLPFLYFLIKKKINKQLSLKFVGIFALGAFQGVVGWYMVKSGLKDAPQVSQYWLAFHLCMAFLIYGSLVWAGLSARLGDNNLLPKTLCRPLTIFSRFLLAGIFLQVMFGAFVAGMHAGLMYNTFPDMDGQFTPPGLMVMTPWYRNFFENATTIQFTHRMFAYTIAIFIFIFWGFSRKFNLTNTSRYAIAALPVIVIVQITLGVLTLLNQVPVILASMHQLFALVLFTLALFITHDLSTYNSDK